MSRCSGCNKWLFFFQGYIDVCEIDSDLVFCSSCHIINKESFEKKVQESKKHPLYHQYVLKAGKEADEELENFPHKGEMGFCHVHWGTQKEILRRKYDMYWMTPAEENPYIKYD